MKRKRAVLGMTLVCVLVTVLSGQAGGVPPSRHSMKGRTVQRYRIVLRAHRRTVEIRRFTIKLSCRDGSTLVDEESGFQRTRLRRGGRFHDDQVGSTDEVWIDGRLGGRGARGKVRVSDRLGSGVRCNSHWVRFTAGAHG